MPEQNINSQTVKPEYFNSIDNYFLIFIGAWMGTRANDWNNEILPLVLLIFAIFAYAIILAWLRVLIQSRFTERPEYLYIGCLIVFILSALYLGGFFDESDSTVYSVIGLIWAAFSLAITPLLHKRQLADRTGSDENERDS